MMFQNLSDCFELNNGYKIPCVGFGTYLADNESVKNAVSEALKCGYRHIDTAAFYGNEKGVGEVVRNCGIDRKDIFVTSKVWNTDRGFDNTLKAFDRTLENLGLDYIDLYLIHWPANKKQFHNAEEINSDTWKAMEKIYSTGRAKAIGLSNFLPHHIESLLVGANIKPMVNQIEMHPGFPQLDVVKYCHDQNIVVEAWSPLGRKSSLENDVILSIADKYDKTPAQVCLRWELQHGVLPLPKSVTPERILSNTDVFDFVLSDEDIKRMDEIPLCGGQCANPDEVDF